MTGPEAEARLRELSEAIARCRRMNIVGLIPDLEAERDQIKKEFIKEVK